VLVAGEKQNISLYEQITVGTSATMDGRSGWGMKCNAYRARMTGCN